MLEIFCKRKQINICEIYVNSIIFYIIELHLLGTLLTIITQQCRMQSFLADTGFSKETCVLLQILQFRRPVSYTGIKSTLDTALLTIIVLQSILRKKKIIPSQYTSSHNKNITHFSSSENN